MALTCRVQYLNDCDPFEYLTHYPEPPRPPVHTFSCTLPLVNQIAAVHRLLKAPHRVSHSPFLDLTVMKGLNGRYDSGQSYINSVLEVTSCLCVD